MKKKIYLLLILLSSIFFLSLYSYSLVDLNLTLINHPLWEHFRNRIIQLGYFQRKYAIIIYLALICFLINSHVLIKKLKNLPPLKIAFLISIFSIFSYPFLSHDFFNYLFDAKILTFYHKNPYFHKALDFPQDPWLRFMHWTHRTYPYGPTWLLITLFPSFFSFGKFILNFVFFKLMFVFFYFLSVYYLNKMNKNWALLFATHPVVIIEGLISPHNDLVALSLAIFGIYYLLNKKEVLGRFFLILSAGIKYITLPLIFLSYSNKKINQLIFLIMAIILICFSFKSEIQPWYFLNLFAFLPFFPNLINKINIFLIGLLFSYYPYIRFGGWAKKESIVMKHQIIIIFLILNMGFLLIKILKKAKKFSKIFF